MHYIFFFFFLNLLWIPITQSVVHRPVALALLGNMLEMQTLGPQPKLIKPECILTRSL